eukprot:GFYU01001966.1.p1 GENE.GFYU01001966.1~~GFYU01001966.1.p1  ORF type:complete len:524 (-),score=138.03 GFYU01001966.1:424-1995(-)
MDVDQLRGEMQAASITGDKAAKAVQKTHATWIRETLFKLNSNQRDCNKERKAQTIVKFDPMRELQSAYKSLEDREKDVQVAAEIGQMLLEKNKDLADDLDSLREKLAGTEAAKNSASSNYIHAEQEIAELTKKNTNLSNRCEMLNQKLSEAEGLLVTHQEREVNMKSEIRTLQLEVKTGSADQSKELQSQLEDFKDIEQELTRKIAALTKENKLLSERLQVTQQKAVEATDENDHLSACNRKLESKLQNFEIMRNELDALKAQSDEMGDIVWENEKLQKMLADQTHVNRRLVSQRQEDIELLEQARMEIQSFRDGTPEEISALKDRKSIFDELNMATSDDARSSLRTEDTNAAQAYQEAISSPATARAGVVESQADAEAREKLPAVGGMAQGPIVGEDGLTKRKDPMEEFFYLTAMSVKLNFEYMDEVCDVKSKTMFNRVLSEEVPFHQWYNWVRAQLTKAHLEKMYERKREAAAKATAEANMSAVGAKKKSGTSAGGRLMGTGTSSPSLNPVANPKYNFSPV